MKKIDFVPKPTAQANPRTADQWVMGESGSTEKPQSQQPIEPTKRLTIDVPLSLHKRFKTQCALQELVMADVIRELLEKRFPVPDTKDKQAEEGRASSLVASSASTVSS